MLKKAIAILILCLAIYLSFDALIPDKISDLETPLEQFSTERALLQLTEISKKPHYTGSEENTRVRHYIISELEKLGLETQLQEGYTISKWGNIAKPINILARIKGTANTKALMLLSHYDSNPHSAIGASDAGSGVVTILEGLRAFLSVNKQPKNDIIIGISDAEELGLNGADLFVNKHEWAKEVGLVLNFEARGSGGPSYMLIETNGGNANLMKEFVAANPQFPVANSLAYSIYKLLPNDTDLTVFRRDGDIEGFNFAFIDDHFDYHTVMDNYARLDRNTLEHQGSYIMPLLHHFSQVNLANIKSTEDYIYFNIPFFKTVIYPFDWILPMLFIAVILFISLLVYGFRNKKLNIKDIGKGFIAFIFSLISCGLLGFLGWEFLNILYPKYGEMLHGFTYNGHTYIWLFVLLSLGLSFLFYSKVYKANNTASLIVAPLIVWLIICTAIALQLKGASFFIIPVYFGLLALFVLLRQKQPNLLLMAVLCIPVLFILSPFVKMFPVGLGLKMLLVSTIFVVLIFGLCLPVLGFLKHKTRWSYFFFFLGIIAFFMAHIQSEFKPDTPKPNSLIYTLNADESSAQWVTYDNVLDTYTKNFLGESPTEASALNTNTFGSKYASGFTFASNAPVKDIPLPIIEISNDTIIGETRHFDICVIPQREVQRIEVFSDSTNHFKSFKINSVDAYRKKGDSLVFVNRKKNRLFSFFVSKNDKLDLQISVPKNQKTSLQLFEASFDLLDNKLFSIPPRERHMIPKPFVLNDAVLVNKTITIE
ncbi:M28 family peptidase [Olleya aquimaris]|uniref:Vacuolar membrane protease n=1 Tax=Olleya aquimaris TaxID=639310 RepID=A0A327RQZ0_9FLAO|nr:M28 family peptidase [Olleya aquimaris]RAJ18013.1 peptidase M28-like protein [Olleya aquimaris]